ncbi:polyprenyl synthetase family protein [Actinoplanes sp. NPDC051513]|uniref:polyprenyl synthetase family protein n=1 Tax=Actinoplanes sp. NPDC051513 TaxID=3363908 RepID=UPI00378B49B0
MANDTLEQNRHREIPRQTTRGTAVLDAIEGTLADFLTAQIASLDAVDPALGGLARTTRDLVLAGGKRLRPTFAYWGWRGVSTDPLEPVLPALAALELMHTFALVHDDVMDDSATRRGRPTAHRIFAGQHGARFGASAAILVGDLCLVWADQLLARAPLPTATLFGVRARYDRMRVEAVTGQYLDVLGETSAADWSVDRALLVARLKTASYTVQRPLQFGLALAGPCSDISNSLDEAYERYGALVGEAFQLRDDLLGVFGDPSVTGKPAGDDLLTGKPTALLLLARQLATPAQLSLLETADLARIAQVIADTGAVARVESMIQERVAAAIAALAAAPLAAEARAALIELTVRATQRPA